MESLSKKYLIYFTLALVVSELQARGEAVSVTAYPFLEEVIRDDSGQGGYNWNMVWDADGVAYIGRDRLWRWDGTHLMPVGPVQILNLRGLAFAPDGKLWLGGHNTLGEFDTASHQYTSRLNWLPEEVRGFGEVWNLHHDGSSVWVGTERQLFQVREGFFRRWDFSGGHRVIFHFLPSGVYAHEVGQGIWRIDGDSKYLVTGDPRIADESIIYLEENSECELIGISGFGVFRILDGKNVIFIGNPFVSKSKISSVCRLKNGELVVGTLGNGIQLISSIFQAISVLGKGTEIDRIISLKLILDPNGDLCIAHTNGISLLKNEFSFSKHSSLSGNKTTFKSEICFNDRGLSIATDLGFITINYITKFDIEITQHVVGEVFGCDDWRNSLLFDRYDRLMKLEGGEVEVFHNFGRAIRTFAVAGEDRLLVGFHDGVEAYRVGAGGGLTKLAAFPLAASVQSLETDAAGRTWGWSPGTPLLEFHEAGGEMRMRRHDQVGGRSLGEMEHVTAVAGSGPVVIFEDMLARTDAAGRGWETAAFVPGLGKPHAQDFRVADGELEGWLVYWSELAGTSVVVRVVWPAGGLPEWRVLPWVDMRDLGRIHQIRADAQRVVIGGMKGLLVADRGLPETIPPPGRPVLWDAGDGNRAAVSRTAGYGEAGPRFAYSSPLGSAYYPVLYQTRLRGLEEEWSAPAPRTMRELGQLFEGSYTFEVRAVDPFGRTSPAAAVDLRILPPWYRSPAAYAACGVLLLALPFGLLRWRERLHRRRERVLENLVAERTRELKRANEFKDEFIANLSHEIRNPLNGVIGLIGQLKEGVAPPARNLSALRGAAHYLRSTVEEVLDFSKLGTGSLPVDRHLFDIGLVASGVAWIYRTQAESKGIALESRIRIPEGVGIFADERKIEQVMGNLTSNAVKFTAAGRVDLAVELEGETGILRIEVADTGPGIPPGEQERVFEKFYQSRHEQQKPSGTGLGLALVKAYVECLGGRIELHSSPGSGSRFVVTLPVEVRPLPREIEGPASGKLPGAGTAVLIVEDMEYNRIVMEGLLQGLGCRVDSAADGQVGLEMALAGSYAAIFLDWDLPTLKGLEIAKALRSSGRLDPGVLIVGMTAYATVDVQQQCLEGGMDAFLTKPLEGALVRQLLESRLARRAPAFVTGRGLLAEMPGAADWEATKARWLGFFSTYVEEVDQAASGSDPEAARKAAHKLLGHLRMVRVQVLPEILQDLQTAAQAGDMDGVRLEWEAFGRHLAQLRAEISKLP